MHISRRRGQLSLVVVAMLLLGMTTTGFRLVSDQELEKIRSADQGPAIDPAQVFEQQLVPWATQRATPLAKVLAAIDEKGFTAACQAYGVQTSQAFPCTFWVKVAGTVKQVARGSRVGRVSIETNASRQVNLMVGPVIPGTAIRDGFPEIKYSDFSNQNSFADFADGLNQQVEQVIERHGELSAGQSLEAVGAYATWDGMDRSIDIVPVALHHQEGH